jgi:hypothetical protein
MKKFIIFLIIVALIAAAIYGYFYFTGSQQEKIKKLEANIALLKETHTPLRFKIVEKSEDSIRLLTKFYDAENEEINKFETTLPGQELSFDFYVVHVQDRYIAFPAKIFSNQLAAANGIELYSYYDKDAYPEVFYSKEINKDLYEGLKDVFRQVKTGQMDSLNNYFGNMVHDIREFKSFIPQTVYSVVTHTKGGIEIIEE